MRKLISHVSLVLVLTSVSTYAQVASVTWGAQNSNGLGEANGTELAIGDLVRLGSFNLTDTQIQQSSNDLNALNAAFVQYDSAFIGDDVNVPAHWNKVSTGSTDQLGINGRKLYYWAFNAPTQGAASQHGIFTSSAAGWSFPSDQDIPNTTITDLEQVNSIVVGGFGNGTSSATGDPLFNLVAVPEPSWYSSLFGALCLTSFVLSRAKRRA